MFNLKQYIANGGTPQKLLSLMMLQNPMMNSLIQMAKSGNIQGVENFARNLYYKTGALGRNRTHNPLVRSQVLYPVELLALGGSCRI